MNFSSFMVIIDMCVCHYLKESRTFCLNRNSTTVNFSTCCSSGVDLKPINRVEEVVPQSRRELGRERPPVRQLS